MDPATIRAMRTDKGAFKRFQARQKELNPTTQKLKRVAVLLYPIMTIIAMILSGQEVWNPVGAVTTMVLVFLPWVASIVFLFLAVGFGIAVRDVMAENRQKHILRRAKLIP